MDFIQLEGSAQRHHPALFSRVLGKNLFAGKIFRFLRKRVERRLLVNKDLFSESPLITVIKESNRDRVVPFLL